MQPFRHTSTDTRRVAILAHTLAVAVAVAVPMPHRLATSWATLTQAACRAHDTVQEDATTADEQPFDWADVDDVDVD